MSRAALAAVPRSALLALGALLLTVSSAGHAAGFDCRAALVLALDLSSSVDPREERLQYQGVAAALTDPEVMRLILTPEGAGIAASAFTWSGASEQRMVADWTPLDSETAILSFAARVAAAPQAGRPRSTAVGRALAFAARRHGDNPHRCDRRIIDIAGDGVTNDSIAPHQVRQSGALDGVEINALVIRGATPDPLRYYVDFVIQGPAAFAIDIDSYDDYADAMRRKLVRELRIDLAASSP